MSHTDRVIVLVDMDCFYCQVEEKLDSKLEGKPIAVVQYSAGTRALIIAVNYPAREKGVTRGMRSDEAQKKCPGIMLPRVPELRGKANLTKYRDAGKRVADVLQTFTTLLQRASVDEAYLDITEQVNKRLERNAEEISLDNLPNSFVVGFETKDFVENLKRNELAESDLKLAVGGMITEEIRAEVFKQTGYKCSAGIAHNKILAKLVCGLHKPNKQTILPQSGIADLYKDLPIRKIQSLGGKLGETIARELQISYMGDLINFSEKQLIKKFDEKTGKWLYNIARGIDSEPVTTRLISKSIGCSKQFPGRSALRTAESVEHWISELAEEMSERLVKDSEENNRRAKQMTVSFAQVVNKHIVHSTRNHLLPSYEKSKIAQGAMDVLRRFCLKANGSYYLTYLGINVGNFQDLTNGKNLKSLFQNMETNQNKNGVNEEIKPHLKDDTTKKSFFERYLQDNQIENTNSTNMETENEIISQKQIKPFFERCSKVNKVENTHSGIEEKKVKNKKNQDDLDFPLDNNDSIYSASTDDLNEDQKSLIYYEDVFSPTDSKSAIFRNVDGSEQSTSKINDYNYEVERPSTKSFFLNYFKTEDNAEKMETEQMTVDNDSIESNIVQERDEIMPVQNECTVNNNTLNTTDRQLCPECNKTILNEEFLSHLDYHFAMKIVKEEAHLYQNPETSKMNKDVKHNKKSVAKRKSSVQTPKPGTKAILKFFNKFDETELNENNSELCCECNKRVKFEDIANHKDYHTAKKLHTELNSNIKISKNTTSQRVSVKETKSKSLRTISAFLKNGS